MKEVEIASLIVSAIAICVALYAIKKANESFKKSMTAQVELYVLSTIKEILLEEAKVEQKDKKRAQYLMTLDYWCKLILNNCLDKKLLKDNIDFIKSQIKEHEIDIIQDEGYNNLVEYARQNQITLERAPKSKSYEHIRAMGLSNFI